MKNRIRLIIIFTIVYSSVFAQNYSKENREKHFNIKKNIGISGYDPVAYFEEKKAIKGNKNIKASYKGVLYHFSSEKNQQLFLKAADKYEPEFGGWCAYAMGIDGSKVNINPETFKVINGRLYLFYNKLGTNTLKLWNENETSLQTKANKYWKNTIQ